MSLQACIVGAACIDIAWNPEQGQLHRSFALIQAGVYQRYFEHSWVVPVEGLLDFEHCKIT